MTHTSISGTRSFSHILIDEAAQALECEALVPMSFVSPDTTVCLAGDPRQLGPQVRSAEASAAGLQFSMMERLLALPAYREEGVFDDAHPVVVRHVHALFCLLLLSSPSRATFGLFHVRRSALIPTSVLTLLASHFFLLFFLPATARCCAGITELTSRCSSSRPVSSTTEVSLPPRRAA